MDEVGIERRRRERKKADMGGQKRGRKQEERVGVREGEIQSLETNRSSVKKTTQESTTHSWLAAKENEEDKLASIELRKIILYVRHKASKIENIC